MGQMTTEQHNLLLDVLAAADNEGQKLNDWEKGFLSDYEEKLENYGEKAFMSDKQEAVLKKMATKLDEV